MTSISQVLGLWEVSGGFLGAQYMILNYGHNAEQYDLQSLPILSPLWTNIFPCLTANSDERPEGHLPCLLA